MDFSFSGIKTAVINLNHKDPNINKADLCASFEKTVTEILIENTKKSINYIKNTVWVDNPDRQQNYPIKLALAGGVSANSYIRSEFLKLKDKGYDIYYPEPILCTDNAAMIASAGYYTYMTGNTSDLSLNAVPNLGIN